jgi:hypothetical protein
MFERFLTFARTQRPLIEARRLHLANEIARVGTVVMQFDKGVPSGYSADPETSYLGKLMRAYEVMGGNAMLDLRLRQRTDPIYIVEGDLLAGPQFTSGGEPVGGRGQADAPTALMVQKAKRWLDNTTQVRFGRLERKIRRAMDYADQLQREMDELTTLQLAADIKGSLEYIAAQIQEYLADGNYRAVYDDQATGQEDRLGLLVNAVLSAYDVETPTDPNQKPRETIDVQKQYGGVAKPGQTSVGGSTT